MGEAIIVNKPVKYKHHENKDIGDIVFSMNDLEKSTNGEFIALDQRHITEDSHPNLFSMNNIKHRITEDIYTTNLSSNTYVAQFLTPNVYETDDNVYVYYLSSGLYRRPIVRNEVNNTVSWGTAEKVMTLANNNYACIVKGQYILILPYTLNSNVAYYVYDMVNNTFVQYTLPTLTRAYTYNSYLRGNGIVANGYCNFYDKGGSNDLIFYFINASYNQTTGNNVIVLKFHNSNMNTVDVYESLLTIKYKEETSNTVYYGLSNFKYNNPPLICSSPDNYDHIVLPIYITNKVVMLYTMSVFDTEFSFKGMVDKDSNPILAVATHKLAFTNLINVTHGTDDRYIHIIYNTSNSLIRLVLDYSVSYTLVYVDEFPANIGTTSNSYFKLHNYQYSLAKEFIFFVVHSQKYSYQYMRLELDVDKHSEYTLFDFQAETTGKMLTPSIDDLGFIPIGYWSKGYNYFRNTYLAERSIYQSGSSYSFAVMDIDSNELIYIYTPFSTSYIIENIYRLGRYFFFYGASTSYNYISNALERVLPYIKHAFIKAK